MIRWKLDIQEYDCDVIYIKGAHNAIADAFSLLCPIVDEGLTTEQVVALMMETFRLTDEEYKMISSVHNSLEGHHGVDRTLERLRSRFPKESETWAYQREHVRSFIKRCPCCQKMSYLKTAIHTLPFTTAAYNPWDRVNVDTIGLLPPDDIDNKYIIVIIDTFTRYVELYPVRSVDAEHAVLAINAQCGRYGVPKQMVSDGGSQFINNIVVGYLTLQGDSFTIRYNPIPNVT